MLTLAVVVSLLCFNMPLYTGYTVKEKRLKGHTKHKTQC